MVNWPNSKVSTSTVTHIIRLDISNTSVQVYTKRHLYIEGHEQALKILVSGGGNSNITVYRQCNSTKTGDSIVSVPVSNELGLSRFMCSCIINCTVAVELGSFSVPIVYKVSVCDENVGADAFAYG